MDESPKQRAFLIIISNKLHYLNNVTLFIHKCYYLDYIYKCKVECLWEIESVKYLV